MIIFYRKPFELKKTLLYYNTSMVFANAFGFYWSVISIKYGKIFLDFSYPSISDRSQETLWYLNLGIESKFLAF